MKNLIARIRAWYWRITFVPKPYMVYWNAFYGWGRICCKCAAFETKKERERFCKRLARRDDFIGIVSFMDGKEAAA